MSALTCFQLPTSQHQLHADRQLMNSLTDALSKTREIDVLHSHILKIMLWQEHLCKNNSAQIDYSDISGANKILAIELITFAQLAPNSMNTDILSILRSLIHLDNLIQVRAQKAIDTLKPNLSMSNQNRTQSHSTMDYPQYLSHILKTKRQFGCMSPVSCLNHNAAVKRNLDHILQEIKQLKNAPEISLHANLNQFSREITYICDFFNRLQTKIV